MLPASANTSGLNNPSDSNKVTNLYDGSLTTSVQTYAPGYGWLLYDLGAQVSASGHEKSFESRLKRFFFRRGHRFTFSINAFVQCLTKIVSIRIGQAKQWVGFDSTYGC